MKVILLQEIKGQGGEGDLVEVKRGYAVNYLLPQKLAIEASKGNLKQLELRKHNIAKREAERLDSADKIQAALADKVLTILARVGEEGQLFGSVTTQQIADRLNEELGLEVDRKKIDVFAPIKTAGEHKVTVTIYRDIKAVVTINVVDEREGDEAEEAATAADETLAEEVAELAEIVEEAAELAAVVELAEEVVELTEEAAELAAVVELAEEAAELEEADELAEIVEEAEERAEAAELAEEAEGLEEALAVAVAADITEAEEREEASEVLGLADTIRKTAEAYEADEKVSRIVEESNEAMKAIANKLAAASDATDDEDTSPGALADAAAEVFQETESVVDVATAAALADALDDEQ
ncbi:MAG: 50S ribosomal protein L9 [Coriobacteriales bacterium]|jgi:large subunit ribosomal protein L9|nr:50S ribosomal protein L9 [Coriobacteriales bacterium]